MAEACCDTAAPFEAYPLMNMHCFEAAESRRYAARRRQDTAQVQLTARLFYRQGRVATSTQLAALAALMREMTMHWFEAAERPYHEQSCSLRRRESSGTERIVKPRHLTPTAEEASGADPSPQRKRKRTQPNPDNQPYRRESKRIRGQPPAPAAEHEQGRQTTRVGSKRKRDTQQANKRSTDTAHNSKHPRRGEG